MSYKNEVDENGEQILGWFEALLIYPSGKKSIQVKVKITDFSLRVVDYLGQYTGKINTTKFRSVFIKPLYSGR